MSNLPTQDYIDDLDRQMRDLREQIRGIQERKNAALIAPWNIEVGDWVRNTGRRPTWDVGMVVSIRPPYGLRKGDSPYDRPWLMIRSKKKDGTLGKSERHTFDEWEKITADEMAA